MSRAAKPVPAAAEDISGARASILYLCFLTSGVAGLVYEVLWAKYLALYVGSTGLAQVIVLATFMGGVALGSEILGRVADRVANPLKLYAFLEFGIGAYALLFEPIFSVGRSVFIATARASGFSPGGLVAGKIIACVLSILLPTFLMGGTLPALGRYMMRTMAGIGPRLSRLYFANSLGAVLGCLLAGFYLIAAFGLQFSMVIGAGLNVLAGVVSLAVLGREGSSSRAVPAAAAPGGAGGAELARWAAVIVLAAVGVSGAVSMMYEVAWIRLLTLVLGSSTYSFSLMLAAFILGLALGSFLLSLRRKTTGYAAIFGLTEAFVGLAILLMLPFYIQLPYWFNQLASSLAREPATFGLYQVCTFAMCAAVMIVPTILQGVTLPAAIKVLVPDVSRLGRRIGFAYAVNTVGTLVGSVGAGFLALPFLGIKGTLELAVALNTVVGAAVLLAERDGSLRRRSIAATVLAALAVWGWYAWAMGPWDRQVLSGGAYRTRERIPSYEKFRSEVNKRATVFYRDGIDATIAVQDIVEPRSERILVINGKVDASTVGDLPTQKLLAHLSLALHRKPERVMIVGVGSGATIGSVLAYEDVKHVDVVEISKDVIDASRFFASVNGLYWQDPRVRVYWEDAKTFLQITETKYDVIISEPTNPWIAGVAGVFSREYFETCREHLAPGGLFVQWIQGYELEDATFYMMLGTFSRLFPCYTLWNPTLSDTILVGSPEPYGPDFDRMEERLAREPVRKDLGLLRLSSLLPILSLQMADHAGAPSHVPWVDAVHSDFYPILEYTAPRGFFIGTEAKGVQWLDRRPQSPVNAGLWVQPYLAEREPTAEALKECFTFALEHNGLFAGAARAWAREWVRRFPKDPAAQAAAIDSARESYGDAPAALPRAESAGDAGWGLVVRKALARMRYADYEARRSWLDAAGAEDLLADVRDLARRYPEDKDYRVHWWMGQLSYDLGQYADAAKSFVRAAQLAEEKRAPRADQIDASVMVCESLIALGDRADALAVCDQRLAGIEDSLKPRLMRARVLAMPEAAR